jgi:HEAT repeat protein
MKYQTLLEKLESSQPAERSYAASDLADLGDLRAIEALAHRLQSEECLPVIESCIESIRYLSTSVLQPLAPLLNSHNPKVRNGVVEILHDASEHSLFLLGDLAENGDRDVRKFALDALRGRISISAIVIIRGRLRDDDDTVRMTAIEYLGELGDSDSAPEILRILQEHPHPMLAFNCMNALARLDCVHIADEFLELYPNLRQVPSLLVGNYLKILGQVGRAEHLMDLETFLLSRPSMNVAEAIEALLGICRRLPDVELSEQLHELLNTMLSDSSATVRGKILQLVSAERQQQFLEHARRQLREDLDPELLAIHLEILRDRGDEADIALLEDLAADIDDEDILDVVAETISNLRERWKGSEAWS